MPVSSDNLLNEPNITLVYINILTKHQKNIFLNHVNVFWKFKNKLYFCIPERTSKK